MLLDRFLSSSVVFPTDYGFIPESIGPDGEDPLDVLVAVSEPTFPGCGVLAKPVAVMHSRIRGRSSRRSSAFPARTRTGRTSRAWRTCLSSLSRRWRTSSSPTRSARATK